MYTASFWLYYMHIIIGLVSFIFSLLFAILTMLTLSKINLIDGWMDGYLNRCD